MTKPCVAKMQKSDLQLSYCQDDRSRTEKDREESDHALALSLAEDLKRPNGMLSNL